MKVLGVDPGLRTSGYAVIAPQGSEVQVLDAGTIRADENLPLAQRLNQIYIDANALLTEQEPDVMAVEELYSHYKHPRTAILMGHARSMFLLAAAQRGIEVRDFSARRGGCLGDRDVLLNGTFETETKRIINIQAPAVREGIGLDGAHGFRSAY